MSFKKLILLLVVVTLAAPVFAGSTAHKGQSNSKNTEKVGAVKACAGYYALGPGADALACKADKNCEWVDDFGRKTNEPVGRCVNK